MSKQLYKELSDSLVNEDAGARRQKWADYIIQHHIDFSTLIPLIHEEKKTAMRFSWLVGELCEKSPDIIKPHVSYFFNHRNKILIPNFDRSLAKMFWLCGIPAEIEGEAIDVLFKWLSDPEITVTTKAYALSALLKAIRQYPELKNELVIAIEEQIGKNSAAFDKKARKILRELN